MRGRVNPLLFTILLVLPLAACGEGSFVPQGPRAERPSEPAEIVPASAVQKQADVPTVDPSRLSDGDILKALGPTPGGDRCLFRYTPDGNPVVAVDLGPGGGARRAVVKVNGDMVILDPATAEVPGGVAMSAGPVRLAIAPGLKGGWGVPDDVREATLRFAVGDELDVGYSGYYGCGV